MNEFRDFVAILLLVVTMGLYGKGLASQGYTRYRSSAYVLYLVGADLVAVYLLLRILKVL